MLILKAALAVILAMPGETATAPPRTAQPAIAPFNSRELARTIKSDLESIVGTGTVNVTEVGGTRFVATISMRGINAGTCNQIYAREWELSQLFPDLSFDFLFDGPELARAIQTDLESISGRGTVNVSIDSKTLFNVRIAIPGFSSEIYSQIYDRELEFYRVFPDLNFDFYLRPKTVEPAPAL
jgi:hypothetical protein